VSRLALAARRTFDLTIELGGTSHAFVNLNRTLSPNPMTLLIPTQVIAHLVRKTKIQKMMRIFRMKMIVMMLRRSTMRKPKGAEARRRLVMRWMLMTMGRRTTTTMKKRKDRRRKLGSRFVWFGKFCWGIYSFDGVISFLKLLRIEFYHDGGSFMPGSPTGFVLQDTSSCSNWAC
jgi:hypothetical protein